MISRPISVLAVGAVVALMLLSTRAQATVGAECCRCVNCTGPQFCQTQDPFNQTDCDAFCEGNACMSGTAQRDPCDLDPGCVTEEPACCLCALCPDGANRCAAIPAMVAPLDCLPFCLDQQGCNQVTISTEPCARLDCPGTGAPAPALTPWALGVLAAVLSLIGVRRLTRSA